MSLGAEAELMALAAGLYVYDSALMLYANEAVLAPRGRRGWSVAFGADAARWGGRYVFVPNLLLVHRPVFRLSWQPERNAAAAASIDWAARLQALRPLAPFAYGAAAGLFAVLPVGLLAYRSDAVVLSALMLAYGSIAAAVVHLCRHRGRLGLSRRALWSIAYECLACPPFAVNLVRKVALRMEPEADLVAAGRILLSPVRWTLVRRKLATLLDDEPAGKAESSEQFRQIKRKRDLP